MLEILLICPLISNNCPREFFSYLPAQLELDFDKFPPLLFVLTLQIDEWHLWSILMWKLPNLFAEIEQKNVIYSLQIASIKIEQITKWPTLSERTEKMTKLTLLQKNIFLCSLPWYLLNTPSHLLRYDGSPHIYETH